MTGDYIFLVEDLGLSGGIDHGVEVGHWLKSVGKDLAGIRLDSGDLTYMSIEARDILDKAGFNSAKMLASNDLDEHVISSLKEPGALIDLCGVGTQLITTFCQPPPRAAHALGRVQ